MPMLEEMNYVPTTRYAFGDEIRRHLDAIATKYGLVDDALFHTGVETSEWDEAVVALGDPHRPRRRGARPLPDHGARDPQPHEAAGDPGHGRVRGQGVPHRALGLRLHRRRPRTTRASPSWPTRSSASSAWARAGSRRCRRSRESAKHVYVFQRTPSAIGERGNRPTADEFAEQLRPGLAEGADGELQRGHDRASGRARPRRRRVDAAHRAAQQPGRSSRGHDADGHRGAWSRRSTTR